MSGLGIHWAQPGLLWVVGAWALVALVVVALDRRSAGALDRLVSSALQSALVARPARWRRLTRLALLVVSGFTMAAALLQPQMGERYVATPRVGAESASRARCRACWPKARSRNQALRSGSSSRSVR